VLAPKSSFAPRWPSPPACAPARAWKSRPKRPELPPSNPTVIDRPFGVGVAIEEPAMPRLWIFSDLHQDWASNAWDPAAHSPDFDIAVVAGDVHAVDQRNRLARRPLRRR